MIEKLPEDKKDVLYLDKFIPWRGAAADSDVLFAVFPSRGAFAIAPATYGRRDDWKIEFPERWRGMDEETLSAEVPGLTFCHSDNLLAVVDNPETAEKVINITKTEWQRKIERNESLDMDGVCNRTDY